MRIITLQIDDSVSDKFLWLLDRFSRDEIKILDQSDYASDDEYLREIEGMIQSIKDARAEPIEQGFESLWIMLANLPLGRLSRCHKMAVWLARKKVN